jgi:hypothetical protein
MLRHRGLGDVEARRQILYDRFAPSERLKDGSAAGIPQRMEDTVTRFSGGRHRR